MKIHYNERGLFLLMLLLGSFYGNADCGLQHTPVTDSTNGDTSQITQKEERQLQAQKNKFRAMWNGDLSDQVRGVILSMCDDWAVKVQGSRTLDEMKTHYSDCTSQTMKHVTKFPSMTAVGNDFGARIGTVGSVLPVPLTKIFPEHNVADLTGQLKQVVERKAVNTSCEFAIGVNTVHTQCNTAALTSRARDIELLSREEFQAFLQDRESLMKLYGCDPFTQNLTECLNPIPNNPDKQCLEQAGFKSCLPFLTPSGCNKDAVLALDSELSQEDKNGMAYICWKAATQGAQCCMNPDQCPTDGAFRSIASQLQKAAPGMVQAFAGLQAIKGDYQKACAANLMANAAGPLGQLRTKNLRSLC